MKSKWYDKKILAVKLRKEGLSIGIIESQLKIPRSTLSGWFKNIELTEKQKLKLEKGRKEGLIKARKNAVLWHNTQKERRLIQAEKEALSILKGIDTKNKHTLNLALAMLYLGEGSKKAEEVSMGNSDPLLLKIFINILKTNYNIDAGRIRCELYLRADQDPLKIKKFWSKELSLPIDNFKYFHIDHRTDNSKTYPDYKGVCMVRYGDVSIKRILLNISKKFCEKVIMGS